MSYAYIFKFVIIGDCGIGKSCLLRRFIDNNFDGNYSMTIGVEFGTKNVTINNKTIKLQLWDTAGQESFRSITKSYYRGCSGIVYMKDITKRNTFLHIENWISDVNSIVHQQMPTILIGNKIDLLENRQVEISEGIELANKHGFLFREISVKRQLNSGEVFTVLAQDILDKVENNTIEISNKNGIRIGNQLPENSNNKNNYFYCCTS